MDLMSIKESEKLTIDIHGYNVEDARRVLYKTLSLPLKEYKEIVVIHGWHRGHQLMDLVRKEKLSGRIKKRLLSINPGVTSLILEEQEESQ